MKKITSIFIMITTLVLALSVSANAAVEIKLSHSGPTPAVGATHDEGC